MSLYLVMALLSLAFSALWSAYGFHAATPAQFPMRFYQYVAGTVDGRPCPAYPVCSAYARQALYQHGAWLGSWLMLDRLIHEADDLEVGPWVRFEGEVRLYDPLHRNDFWLDEGQAVVKD